MLRTIPLLSPIIPDIVRSLAELLSRPTQHGLTDPFLHTGHKRHPFIHKRMLHAHLAHVRPVAILIADDRLAGVLLLQPVDTARVDHAEIPPCALDFRDPRILKLDGRLVGNVGPPDLPADACVRVVREGVRDGLTGGDRRVYLLGNAVGACARAVDNIAHDGEGTGVDDKGTALFGTVAVAIAFRTRCRVGAMYDFR